MRTVKAIHISAVKSFGLTLPQSVRVDSTGIVEDRRLHLIDRACGLLTQRQVAQMVQLKAEYQVEPERLRLRFPDGNVQDGPLELGEPVITDIFGRDVPGRVVTGDWNEALSGFCGQPVRLIRSDKPGQCYDEYPISLATQASVEELKRQPGATSALDSRRFRPNFLLEGCEPHEEDTWLDDVVGVGESLRLRLVARDPRCVMTTHNPDTGERDIDTLRLIMHYRPSLRAAYFGVYGIVEQPGTVHLGDAIAVRSEPAGN